jgi:hypothetical protein
MMGRNAYGIMSPFQHQRSKGMVIDDSAPGPVDQELGVNGEAGRGVSAVTPPP